MKNIKELTIKELTLINGGVSSNPGTQNWINGLGNSGISSSGGSSMIGEALNKKIGECIAYGLAGRRGPFGCNS